MISGKITEADLKRLKSQYLGPLFKWAPASLKDVEFVFRPIDKKLQKIITDMLIEAEKRNKATPVEDVNERLFDSCVVWPELTLEEKQTLPVGTIPSLAKAIQEKSGYVDIDIYGRDLGPDLLTTIIRDYDFWGDVPETTLRELRDETKFKLYRVRIDRWVFIVRPMTRTDMQVSSQSSDEYLALVKCVCMWPKEVPWDVVPAGVVDILVKEINKISGWELDSDCEEI